MLYFFRGKRFPQYEHSTMYSRIPILDERNARVRRAAAKGARKYVFPANSLALASSTGNLGSKVWSVIFSS